MVRPIMVSTKCIFSWRSNIIEAKIERTFAASFKSMSDYIKHEWGIALVRLLTPLSYYKEKYGTPYYGENKLYLLWGKQHNRGQVGVGIASIKLYVGPRPKFIPRS